MTKEELEKEWNWLIEKIYKPGVWAHLKKLQKHCKLIKISCGDKLSKEIKCK